MNIINAIQAIGVLAILGLFFGFVLSIANQKLEVKRDPKYNEIIETLPGANCGACGYPGCAACANAILKGEAPVNICPVGGVPCSEKLAVIMGVENVVSEPTIAKVTCNGTPENADNLYAFKGIKSCHIAKTIYSGMKVCDYGCFGLGTCEVACPFDAITMVNGLPSVNPLKCTSCEKCVKACPQMLMKIVPRKQRVFVNCNNIAKPKDAMKACKVACIKCKRCEKVCPTGAIKVTDLARIDYSLCTNCEKCVQECPKFTITTRDQTLVDGPLDVKEEEKSSSCGSCTGCNNE